MERIMPAIKTIGSRGQITLGKQLAGQRVLIDELEPGVWLLKVGDSIPRSERWLHEPKTQARLDRAIRWAEEHPESVETDLDELERRLDMSRREPAHLGLDNHD